MKITCDCSKLTKHLNDFIKGCKETANKFVDALSKDIETNARRNYNNAINEITGDDPYIYVSRQVNGASATVRCEGSQVLFAEFGAGKQNSYREIDTQVGSYTRTSVKGTVYTVNAYTRTMIYSLGGFAKGGMIENIPRPSGIVELGHYGKGYGMNDFWVRPTTNHRLADRESNVHKKNGDIRNDVVWTMGNRPLRCLYRARNTAIADYKRGRLKVK